MTQASNLLKWGSCTLPKGVITGASSEQEWMLPHWWRCYTALCQEPVAFIDFGMSPSARAWCQAKGSFLPFHSPSGLVREKSAICPIRAKFWERIYPGNVWKARPIWFAKIFALLQTPYRRTIWIDLDCEVKQPLDDLFHLADNPAGLAVTPTTPALQKASEVTGLLKQGERGYNPGVLAFKHGSPALFAWAKLSIERNGELLGDENTLSRALLEGAFPITSLPLTYNWPFFFPENLEAKIIHFFTDRGKRELLHRMSSRKHTPY